MGLPVPVVALIGVIGLAVGSFLNVVIYRVPRQESIFFPNSHCPACSEPIKARHNIPLFGWLWLRGRCASCHARISVRYPLVELSTAVLFVALAVRLGPSPALPAYLYLCAIGIALALIDVDVHRLPDSVLLPSYVVGILLLMSAGAAGSDWRGAERAVVGMLALMTIYFALEMAYPQGSGLANVKLAGLLGLYLGWSSWGSLLVGTVAAIVLAAVGGSLTLTMHRGSARATVAFVPTMVLATMFAVFLAPEIGHWYGLLLRVT